MSADHTAKMELPSNASRNGKGLSDQEPVPASATAEGMTDSEVRDTDVFRSLRDALPSSKSAEEVIELAREKLMDRWKQALREQRERAAQDFIARWGENGDGLKGPYEVVLYVDEDGSVDFDVRDAAAKGSRWGQAEYARFVGREFTRTLAEGRCAGTYTLRIKAGRHASEKVLVEVVEPSGRVIACPPASPGNPVRNDQRVEVARISQVMAASLVRGTSPLWSFFGISATPSPEHSQGGS